MVACVADWRAGEAIYVDVSVELCGKMTWLHWKYSNGNIRQLKRDHRAW